MNIVKDELFVYDKYIKKCFFKKSQSNNLKTIYQRHAFICTARLQNWTSDQRTLYATLNAYASNILY